MIIYHHLGLGDHIICHGLVRSLIGKYFGYVICKHNNVKNVAFMYRDNPKIGIIPVKDDNEANDLVNCISIRQQYTVNRIGQAVGGKYDPSCLWDESFYRGQNIPFYDSYQNFYYHRDYAAEYNAYKKLNPDNREYAFVHAIGSNGKDGIDYSKIDPNLVIITPRSDIDFFSFGLIIQNAREIHCINSSFKHLVERLATTDRLFYHRRTCPLPYSDHTTLKKWIEV